MGCLKDILVPTFFQYVLLNLHMLLIPSESFWMYLSNRNVSEVRQKDLILHRQKGHSVCALKQSLTTKSVSAAVICLNRKTGNMAKTHSCNIEASVKIINGVIGCDWNSVTVNFVNNLNYLWRPHECSHYVTANEKGWLSALRKYNLLTLSKCVV